MKPLKDFKHKLITRRDFLAHGLIAFAGMASLPSAFGMGLRKALEECGGGVDGPSLVPFMAFDMAGGASFPGNFLVGKKGGPEDLLKSYSLLGWNPHKSKALNKDFGLPMAAGVSKILEGILSNSSNEARKNFRMGSICHAAPFDTTANKTNAATLALRAGFRGTYISNGVGVVSSPSGGNSSSVIDSVVLKPIFVMSIDDILGSSSFGGSSLGNLKLPQLKTLAQSAIEISRIQKNDYLDLPDGKVLGELSKCAYEKSLDFLEGVAGLDPRTDPEVQAVYQIDQNTTPSTANAVAAALVMNTLKGQSGPAVWTLGDCDYHDGTQTTGDAKDLEMGVQIGRAIELAHRLKKPFFFQLLTDGGNENIEGTRMWSGDSEDKCMTVIGYYSPSGPPKMIRTQVGHFTEGQGADRNTLLGRDPSLVGYAVFANYLNICGKIDEFPTHAPGIFTEAGQLKSVLIFEGKV
ncbi:MAG: hypothetical protein SGJ18_02585 [Pseudomonadota bacterium]|nr:hypothetical protein [Pseudomonadota bacterium]